MRFAIVAVFLVLVACPPPQPESAPCSGHDGGDGACVDVGSCSDGYDLEPGGRCSRWVALPDAPIASIRGVALRLADERVLIVGGATGSTSTDKTVLYLPDERRWVTTDPLRVARSFHLVIQLDDGRVVAAGGELNSALVLSTEIYDPAVDTWSQGPPLPAGFVFSQIFLDGQRRAHIISGLASDYALDLDANTWSLVAGPREPRVAGAVHVVDGQAVLFSGFQNSATVGSVEALQLDTGVWSRVAASDLLRRVQFASGVLGDGRIVTAGGSDGFRPQLTTAFIDVATGSIEPGPLLVTAAQFYGATSLKDGGFLLVGGGIPPDGYRDDVQMILQDGSMGLLPPLPRAVILPYVVELADGNVLVASGADENGEFTDSFLLERGK